MLKFLQYLALIILGFSGFPECLHGQWRSPLLERFGPDDGLTGEVRDIVQDPYGFIYLASDQGLYQYNGKDFKLYLHNPEDSASIAPGHLIRLFVSSDSLVWLAIYNSGVNSFNPKTGKFKRYPLPEHNLSHLTGASSVGEDQQGNIWVGAYHGRLYKLDAKTGIFKLFRLPGIEEKLSETYRISIRYIMPSVSNPDVLLLSVYGMAHPDFSYHSQGLISFNTLDHSFSWFPCNLYARHQDPSGVLWGSTWGSNIVRFDPGTEACDWFTFQDLYGDFPEPFGGPITFDITRYQDKLLIANLGVLEFNEAEKINFFIQPELDKEFSSMFVDKSQNLWLGHPQGAMVLAPKYQNIRFFSLAEYGVNSRLYPGRLNFNSTSNAIILGFHQDGLPNRLFSIPLDKASENKVLIKEMAEPVTGTAVDPSGRIYFKSGNKIYETGPDLADVKEVRLTGMDGDPLPWVWQMKAHPDGWICGLGTNTFFWFDKIKRSLKKIDLKDLIPGSHERRFEGFSFISQTKALLHSTSHLHLVDLTNGSYSTLKFNAFLEKEFGYITCAKEGKNGDFWISTNSKLIKAALKGDSLAEVKTFTTNDGIISPTMKEFQIDQKGRIWLFTNSGMDAFDVEKEEVRHFGLREGLADINIDPVQVVELPDGRIATVNGTGVIVFHPDSLWHAYDPVNAPLVVQDLRINGKPLSMDVLPNFSEIIQLPLSAAVVDLTFNALAYPKNNKVSYSYRLNGAKGDWIGIGSNNFLTLPDLPFGETELEVKAGPPDHNVTPKKIWFKKPTPFYAQAFFLPALAILGIVTIFGISFIRIRQIESAARKEMEINRQLAETELKALRSQMNPHFMFNSLNSIKTYVLEAKPEIAADYLSQFAHLIRKILQNSREKKITLREEIDTLLLYISLEKFRFENAFEFEHHVDSSLLPLDDIMIPPMLVQPFIENAIWHGLMHKGKGGILKLLFIKKDECLQCIIDDNGVGRERAAALKSLSARKHKSMGLGITQSRVDLLNTLNAFGITIETIDKKKEDGEPLGTQIILSIPLDFDED